MTANNIIEICQRLIIDFTAITPQDIKDLVFVMNTQHLRVISEHYGYEIPSEKFIETKIFGYDVIHNEYLPMYQILLGFKKDIQL